MSERSSTSSGTDRPFRPPLRLVAALLVAGIVAETSLERSPFPRQREASAAPATAETGAGSIDRLRWMAGCWERRTGTRLVEEQWMEPRGGMMLGVSRTVRGDTLVEYEQIRIYERGGKLVFAAMPSGQAPSEFESTEVGDSVVVFENPKHDFPQRILYCRAGLDSMVARVEGVSRGKQRRLEFPYVHIACPSGGPSPMSRGVPTPPPSR